MKSLDMNFQDKNCSHWELVGCVCALSLLKSKSSIICNIATLPAVAANAWCLVSPSRSHTCQDASRKGFWSQREPQCRQLPSPPQQKIGRKKKTFLFRGGGRSGADGSYRGPFQMPSPTSEIWISFSLLLDTQCNYEAICRNLILGGRGPSKCLL